MQLTQMSKTSSVVVLGAGGFLGRALIESGLASVPIKAVSRIIPLDMESVTEGVTWFAADLGNPKSLQSILEEGDIVLNLVYMSGANETGNTGLLDNIVEACLKAGATRLIHCSTAVVAGATRVSHVTEVTPCVPQTSYERIKLALEQRAVSALSRGLDVGILRPTAIVGPGGQNLRKLATSLQHGNEIANYFRASLSAQRRMHLVPVIDVIGGLLHLAAMPAALGGGIFIVSSDDDPGNNFNGVEEILLNCLGKKPRRWPLVPFSPKLLGILLKLLGRSDTDTDRIYDSQKLRGAGFTSNCSIAEAVRDFGVDFQKTNVSIDCW
jgi:nucleoside-diphosphate-sugar epimerase